MIASETGKAPRRLRTRLIRLFGTPSRQVAAAAALIAVVMAAVSAHQQWVRYHQAISDAGRQTHNVALLLAEHAARTFDGIEETLRAAGRLQADIARGAGRSLKTIHVDLKTLRGGSTVLREVGWFGARGERVATSAGPDPPHENVAGRDFFQVHTERKAPRRFVTAPHYAIDEGMWSIVVSIRLENPDGSFAGVAAGTLDPGDFAELYRSLDLGPRVHATLFRRDGIVLAHAPGEVSVLGRSAAESTLFRIHVPRGQIGSFEAAGPLDAIERIGSFAAIGDKAYGTVVAVGMDRARVGRIPRRAGPGLARARPRARPPHRRQPHHRRRAETTGAPAGGAPRRRAAPARRH